MSMWRKKKMSDWLSITHDAVKILKGEEGWRGYIYDDYDGNRIETGQTVTGTPTAMYGMTQFLNDRVPQEIFLQFPRWGDMGLALYVKKIIEYDLLRFTELLTHLNHARLVVLICMIYQLGFSGVLGFHRMLEAILAEDWDKAAAEMIDSKWHQQTAGRAERMAEIMRKGKL